MHDLDLSIIKALERSGSIPDSLAKVSGEINKARDASSPIILMMGAHVIRSGVQKYLIDLMENGYISCVSMNGAGVIHDFEFALIGATTESVAKYIRTGQFGLWKETGEINEIVNKAYKENIGIGEAVGREILNGNHPHKDISILAGAYKLGIPATVHVGIGYDIIHEHPNFDGAATGAASYTDFLIFTEVVRHLENGVIMNFGSAVMAPEVFLKALSMARNAERQEGKPIKNFTTLVCDLLDLPTDYSSEASKESPPYYFRPWKTMLIRTVAEGGRGYYVRGKHGETIPALWTAIKALEKGAVD
ncbi:hypothetical protein ACFL9T_17535 [Thermodesulfobacteriota bacterium]